MAQSANLTQCDKNGAEMSLYFSTGTCATPVWIFHKGIIGDLQLGETEDQNELTSRDPAQIVKQYTEGKIAMRAKGSPGDICILTGYMSEVGSFGWRGHMRNFDRSISGPENGAARQSFMLKPAACVLVACKVRPVKVTTADSVADYSPQTFTPTV